MVSLTLKNWDFSSEFIGFRWWHAWRTIGFWWMCWGKYSIFEPNHLDNGSTPTSARHLGFDPCIFCNIYVYLLYYIFFFTSNQKGVLQRSFQRIRSSSYGSGPPFLSRPPCLLSPPPFRLPSPPSPLSHPSFHFPVPHLLSWVHCITAAQQLPKKESKQCWYC